MCIRDRHAPDWKSAGAAYPTRPNTRQSCYSAWDCTCLQHSKWPRCSEDFCMSVLQTQPVTPTSAEVGLGGKYRHMKILRKLLTLGLAVLGSLCLANAT